MGPHLRSIVPALSAAALLAACNGSSSNGDGGGGSAGAGSGGRGGASGGVGGASAGRGGAGMGGAGMGGGGFGGSAGQASTGGGGQGGSPCRAQGASCSSSEPCCLPLICAGGCTMGVSDRGLKRDIDPVNAEEVLEALSTLPVSTWSYRTEASGARHMGPMAQDFMATFHVGSSDKVIFQVDGDGVAFAAIQALNSHVKRLTEQNAALARELSLVRLELSRRNGSRKHRPQMEGTAASP